LRRWFHGWFLGRTKEWLARFVRRAPAPGRWTRGTKFAWRGWLTLPAWVLPRREYLLYLPAGWSRWRRAPLVVFCHGCKQTPEEFAQGTRIAALADRLGWLVLLPRQKESANAWFCWNWFDPRPSTARRSRIVAAMMRSVPAMESRRSCTRSRRRNVGGRRAGRGARLREPDVVRAVIVHSGLACGAARSAFTAIGVMQRGPETDVEAIAEAARRSPVTQVPLLALHGEADHVVAAVNTTALVRSIFASTIIPRCLRPCTGRRACRVPTPSITRSWTVA
jgi:poly(3-hydroxybutyrate) depolymerase